MIVYTYTEEDKKDLIKSIPFHIERTVDIETDNTKGSFLFDDSLLLEDPLEEIIDIVLEKTPLNSSDNHTLGIIRDPGKKDVPVMFQSNDFWQTFFKHSMGSLYNELILYSYNRLKFPYVNEISLLYDSIFYGYEDPEKSISFENTLENETLSTLKLDSMSNFMDYKTPQIELIDYWLTHLVASGFIKTSEKETETVLYRAQDLRNELVRRKVAGSLVGYSSLLNSINVAGTLYPALPIAADENSLDPRLSRGINLPGITTTIPSITVIPDELFPDIPVGILNPAYYSSIDYNQESFLANPSDFLRFKKTAVVWDNLSGIVDISLVKVSYSRLDKNPLDYLDVNGSQTEPIYLDDETPIFNFSVSSETFLDIQANKIYNIQNTLQVKKRELYPYYVDTVAQGFGPTLSDIPWLSYVEKFIDEKKRVSEEVRIGMQLSLLDTSEENYIVIRELGFLYKESLDSETESYIYEPGVHQYMYIYSVEIQYHRASFRVKAGFPVKTLMTIVYLKQPKGTGALKGRESYEIFTTYSSGLLPFKFKDIQPGTIPNYTLLLDESDEEEPLKDYIDEADYSKAYFFFMKSEHEKILTRDTITPAAELLNDVGDTFSYLPPELNSFYFIYGYEHENKLTYWSHMLPITRLDFLMALKEMRPDWHENIFYINPYLNFNTPNCTFIDIEGEYLQSLSSVHRYEVYNNDSDMPTSDRTAASLPQGFYLHKYRDVLYNDVINESFQIWGDYRNVREEYTLTVTSDPSADETITIILDGAAGVDIAILETDDADSAAIQIDNGVYPGWNTEIDSLSTNSVIFSKIGEIVETNGEYSVTAATTQTTFIQTKTLGDPLDDEEESLYRNIPRTDIFGLSSLLLDSGQNYSRGAAIDTYYNVVSSTNIDSESDKPLWYWNRIEAYEGMTFFTKIRFSENGLVSSGAVADIGTADNQYLLVRSNETGETADPGDEFEIYYDQINSKFVFKMYPTGYSISNAASNNLGELIFVCELDWVMNIDLPIRVGFTYKFDPVEDDLLKRIATLTIIVDGEVSEQKYTITQTGTSGTITAGASDYTATYEVYDENLPGLMQVASSTDIVLDDSVFNYNARYSAGAWEHFLGMLHKDGGQSGYLAEEINLFHNKTLYPFMGEVYDIRLHTAGFSTEEMYIHNRGTRREVLTGNIDSVKVYNHFAGDYALGRRYEDTSGSSIDRIRAFDRSKWNSNLVDPQAVSTGETVGINDRYNPNYANPLIDRDTYVYEGSGEEDMINPDVEDYDDADGVIKSFLKNNLETIQGFSWDENYSLHYKGSLIPTNGKMFDLVQTSLYPITYDDFPIATNPDLILDGTSLKSYEDDIGYKPIGSTSVVNIDTSPSGDTLIYKCDLTPYFTMSNESFPARGFYKGDRLQHCMDTTLDEVSVEISDSTEPPKYLSRLLVMPLYIPSQNPGGAVDDIHLNALSIKGLKLSDVLQKILNPSSYYQEFIYPYDNGYRIDVVRSIKEGVYFIPVKLPVMIEADYNSTKEKIIKNIETLIKVEVVGTIIDDSTNITDETILNFYEKTETDVEVSRVEPDANGRSFYRQITIKAFYYKNVEAVWSWEQILSNDITELASDSSLAYTSDDVTVTKNIEFYLSDKLDLDEFFTWSTDTFIDRAAEPVSRIQIYDQYNPKPVDTAYLEENSSYLMYINLKSVTANLKFSTDFSCEPYNSVLFENHNYNDIINIFNKRLTSLDISNSAINAGFSISGGVFEAVDTGNGVLGNPYSNNQENYLLNDLDPRFIDSNVYTMKYTSFYSGVEALNSFPVGFFIDENNANENTTVLWDDGDLREYNINEKESLKSHFNANRINTIGDVVKGFYSVSPVIDSSPIGATEGIDIDVNASLHTYKMSLDSRTIPKWMAYTGDYNQFRLYKNIFFEKIKELGESYSSVYYLEHNYTAPGDYTILFIEKDIYNKAYVQVSLSTAASINGVAIPSATPTWIVVDIISGALTLTSDTATTMNILNIKPYDLLTDSLKYKRFLSMQDNTGQRFAVIGSSSTFVYLSEDTLARRWFIQFASSFEESSLSADRSFTSFNGYLEDFLNTNLDLKTGLLKNPWVYTVVYKEKNDNVSIYIKGDLVANSNSNLIYVEHMSYNAAKNSISIGKEGSADEDRGIVLNSSPLVNTNLGLADNILIANERMTAINNCIDPNKIQKRKSSVNAITNVQLMSGDTIVYEFEFPPLVYDELTQHISFNILLSR